MKKALTALMLALWVCAPLGAATYYVATDGDDSWDGTAATYQGGNVGPKETIQAGIDITSSGDTVIVAEGIYVENIVLGDPNNITLTSTNPENWTVVQATIIDGNNSTTTVTFENDQASTTATLTGFTITGGNSVNTVSYGGGILVNHFQDDNVSPTITNCIIEGNKAKYGAGIAINWGGLTEIENCIIRNNEAFNPQGQGRNGGIYTYELGAAVVNIRNCEIVHNISEVGTTVTLEHGGELINCRIAYNSTTEISTGGAAGFGGKDVTIDRCIIDSNVSKSGGGAGGMMGNSTIKNSLIVGNVTRNYLTYEGSWGRTGGWGLGPYAASGDVCTVSNCTIVGNLAHGTVDGLYYGGGGGVMRVENGTINIDNCIIQDNYEMPNMTLNESNIGLSMNISYSDIGETTPGYTNINEDPCFVMPYDYADCTIVDADEDDELCVWQFSLYAVGDVIEYNGDGVKRVIYSVGVGSIYFSPDIDGEYSKANRSIHLWKTGGDPNSVVDVDEDWHITLDSPCLNAGDPSKDVDDGDIDDDPRVYGGCVDMGADEIARLVHNVTQDLFYDNISEAVDESYSNDEIVVYPGIYYETVSLSGDKDITLRGENPDNWDIIAETVIDGEDLYRGLVWPSGDGLITQVRGLTISNCHTNNGGAGIYCYRNSPVIENCQIIDCSANTHGGGVFMQFLNMVLRNCRISNCSGLYGGSVYINTCSEPTIENCLIVDNAAPYGAGMCTVFSSLIFNN